MKILILEDDPDRVKRFKSHLIEHDVTYTDDTKACIQLLNSDTFDAVFLDHDLFGKTYVKSGENTGYEVAEWLGNNPDKKPDLIIIHSLNGNGAKLMQEAIKSNSYYIPFLWEVLGSKINPQKIIETLKNK